MAKNRPVHEIRLGRIRAAIWANEGEGRVWHSVTVSRLYKDRDEWKNSDSFSREDLPLVAKAVDKAHTWLYELKDEGGRMKDD